MQLAYTKKLDIEKIKNMYINQIKSSSAIAKEFGVSWSTITSHLRRANIKLRPTGGNVSRRIYSDKERLLNRRVSEHKRRILVGSPLTLKDIQETYERNIKHFGTLTCYLCLKRIDFGSDSIDHIIPVSRGGTNHKSNLAIAHKQCNSKKHTKLLHELKEDFYV